ncbi:MAG: biopolymer transporter ExbD [Leptolyngbyaceae cyanobacterium T60_A2020_046]|nr:biopolymer transporter ExbD [Leptolyngbyaceae cyanobacterium T60_A2020_046]
MQFRQRNTPAPPQIDLIPMLTVMMGVLAFFVVVTMTLGSEQLIEMQLPAEQPEDEPPPPLTTQPFIVQLDATGQLRLNNAPIDQAALEAQMQAYLERRADNTVYLLPDQSLPYEDVMRFLGEMREVGGDRITLAIEE